MTLKQRKFVDAYHKNGGNGKAAAIASGSPSASAKGYAHQTLKSANVQAYLYACMQRMGLTNDYLLRPVKDGCKADKVISATVIVKSDDPTVREKPANSRTMDFIEVPDHPTRLKAAELGFRLKGCLPTEPSGAAAPITVNIVHFALPKEPEAHG